MPALLEQSQTAVFACSSTLPILSNGIASSTAFSCSGTSFDHFRTLSVNVMLGQMELTRIPWYRSFCTLLSSLHLMDRFLITILRKILIHYL